MQNELTKEMLANPHVSVDCVVIGFDGEDLRVLLVRQIGKKSSEMAHNMKLPGSLIYDHEDLDEAAQRVLNELAGIKSLNLIQFHAFGSKNRTHDPKDVNWVEHFHHMDRKVERIVTIAYLAMVKINKKLTQLSDEHEACWIKTTEIGELAFDHNQIIEEAFLFIRQYVASNPAALFDLLPHKFTAAQMRRPYELTYNRKMDVRNFHKKISMMEYIVPLEEKQTGVPHRAARYYKFDKKTYNKIHGTNKSFKNNSSTL